MVADQIRSHFKGVCATGVGQRVGILLPMDGRLTRAEKISPHRKQRRSLFDTCFRQVAVGLAWLAVNLITESAHVHQPRRER